LLILQRSEMCNALNVVLKQPPRGRCKVWSSRRPPRGRCSRHNMSSSVTVISPSGMWKLEVSLCHLSANALIRHGSRC
ncbi:hypothetical protein A2U01_0086212, partial [Trifolium medium]|nr:hypothetical protein [Trifolium medium]